MRRYFYSLFISLLVLASPAWAGNILLALSENSGPYNEFSSTLEQSLGGSNWKILATVTVDTLPSGNPAADIIVTAGASALRQVLARGGQTPIIATLLPRQSYEKILADAGKSRQRITAIWLDQPPARQAAFLRQLFPNQKRVGMLFSPETRDQSGAFRQSLSKAGLTLDSEDSDTEAALLPALNGLLPRVGLLLAIPDTSIYRRENIKAILVTAYRHQRPLVAFSPTFVNAGALAALYSTPAQIARQAADWITGSGVSLPPPAPPGQFAIAINFSVAQSMGLAVPDETSIRRAMLAERETK